MIPGWLAGWETLKGQALEKVGVGRVGNYESPGGRRAWAQWASIWGLLRRMRNCDARLRGCLSTWPVRPLATSPRACSTNVWLNVCIPSLIIPLLSFVFWEISTNCQTPYKCTIKMPG